jgi:hypothetical protein
MLDRDPRPYFTISNEMPRNAKIRRLSDAAFRMFIELLADANQYRTDGLITTRDINVRGAKVGKELIAAGLVDERDDGDYEIHDYLKHQKSRKDLAKLSNDRSDAAVVGNHIQHHVKKRIVKQGCPHCPTETAQDFEAA